MVCNDAVVKGGLDAGLYGSRREDDHVLHDAKADPSPLRIALVHALSPRSYTIRSNVFTFVDQARDQDSALQNRFESRSTFARAAAQLGPPTYSTRPCTPPDAPGRQKLTAVGVGHPSR